MRITARAHPNIALVKYWGKRDSELNLPAVGSISITLGDLWTDMRLDTDTDADALTVNGEQRDDLKPRIARCLDMVLSESRQPVSIISESNFPVAAGLASSASAFAAAVVAAAAVSGREHATDELANLAAEPDARPARFCKGSPKAESKR